MSPRLVRRRTLALGAAWAIPTAVMSVGAPAFAASVCPRLTMDGTWTAMSDPVPITVSGVWSAPDGVPRYRNVDDNNYPRVSTLTLTSPTISLTRGTRYSLSFTVCSGFGGNNADTSRPQHVDLFLADTNLLKFSTRALNGYTTLNTVNMQQPAQTFTAQFIAAADGPATFRYVFTSPLRATPGPATQDDIAVSAPTITCT